MPSPAVPAKDAQAENTGAGTQALHQGEGHQNLAIGENSVQQNSFTHNYYNAFTLRSVSELEKLFKGREEGFGEPNRGLIIDWLQAQTQLSFIDHHQILLGQLAPGTATWIFDSLEFQKWKVVDHQLRNLWIHGILGSGKTMIATSIIHFLQKEFGKQGQDACIYLYFQDGDDKQPALIHILISLLKQLLQQKSTEDVSNQLKDMYTHWCRTKVFPYLDDYESLLKAEIAAFEAVYLVVDALDNYQQQQPRDKFLTTLRKMPNNLRVLITSRTGWLVARDLESRQELRIEPRPSDVEKYIRNRIQGDEVLRRELSPNRCPGLDQKVVRAVMSASNGIFLLTKLHMDFLSEQGSPGGIRSALKSLPESSHRAFNASIEQIKRKDQSPNKSFERGLAKHVLTWTIHAKRSLTTEEIKDSFAIHHSKTSLNHDYIPSEVDWTSLCAGFVVVDPKSQILRLVHESVGKYLLEKEIVPHRVDIDMAKLCLKYLLFEESKNSKRRDARPLFEYASAHWATHFRLGYECTNNDSSLSEMEDLALKFLKSRHKVEDSFKALAGSDCSAFYGMTGLHAAVYFDLPLLVKRLIDGKVVCVNTMGPYDQTALHWAVQYHRPAIVELLLQRSANPNVQDLGKDTPLHAAVIWTMENSDDFVHLLLEYGARMDVPGSQRISALSWAIRYGPESTATILVNSLLNVNSEICEGFTPLRQVMTYYQDTSTTIIDLLLKKGVELNKPSTCGWTPLGHAVRFLPRNIICRLLRRRSNPADVNLIEPLSQRSPMGTAIFHDRRPIIHLLIDHGANVNEVLSNGSTPLIEAVKSQDNDTIWKLLYKGASCDDQDNFGETALHHAIKQGGKSIAWLLLVHKASVALRDKSGCNALDWAIEKNNLSTLWLLCHNDGTQVDDANEKGITILHRASGLGKVEAVSLLVDKVADKNKADNEGLTPLHYATLESQEGVVQILSSSGADLNYRDSKGATALHHAISLGQIRMICLLRNEGANLEVFDNQGRTPLMLAAFLANTSPRTRIVRLLLQLGADAHKRNENGLSAWHFASGIGRTKARRQIEKAINP